MSNEALAIVTNKQKIKYENGGFIESHFELYFRQALEAYLKEIQDFAEVLPLNERLDFAKKSANSLENYLKGR